MSFAKPKIKTPAAAPATPDIRAPEQVLGGENPTTAAHLRKKKGRAALRIDLQHGGSGLSAGQTGVNIPTA